MFFVLLNEDQTQGFFGQSPPSSLFHLEQWGSRDWRTSSTSREEHFFPLLSPSIHFILPLSPTLSLISLSGTQSVSASLSEFIISLRRPWPRWIRALKFFHQHVGEAGETVRETKCDKAQETHQRGVQLSLDWARRLKRVCTQACDKAKGQGRCQMRAGPWLTSDLSSKDKGQPKTRVGWCSSYVPFPHEKTRLMN